MAKAKQTAKATAKTRQATAAEKATKSDKGTTETPVKDLTALVETPEEFKSMCGFEFDPAQAGSCYKTCQGESPEAFASCVENFKLTAKKTTSVSKAKRGKNVFGHLNGCQGALIDDALLTGKAFTIEKLMKNAKATHPRVVSHLKHLYAVWNVDLQITDKKEYFIKGAKSGDLVGLKSNGVKIIEEAIAKAS